ncbi:DDE-type integrase/transposase/recombinase [Brucella cytisi]|jgi:putative transposase|uniref:DDE-type integrase/transposase/recombinase n=1 Tax=Brucella cytisi TaxID=407152 RepID=UPI0035DDF18A
MDEVIIAIGGRKFWLGRAIDTDADVLDIQVPTRRNTKASQCFAARLVSLALS